jgi:hypothetical protein
MKRSKLLSVALKAAAFVLITGAFLVVLEGLSSVLIAAVQVLDRPTTEASHYDADIGWVGLPNANIPNMYGPERYVRTNSRGFRNEVETEATVTPGRVRIICSGDSFTYGQGVANNHTWCHHLTELDERFETVNMGQPGYGVGQMFLWYSREGVSLDHSIHIFAFVHGDLDRMARADQHGYGKPVLQLEGGELVSDKVPVPRFRWWVNRAVERADLRSLDLAQRVMARLSSGGADGTSTETIGPVAFEVFRQIKQLSVQNTVVPAIVFFPTQRELESESSWRSWVEETMATLGMPLIDLTSALHDVSAGQVGSFFIPQPRSSAGHYTEAGNHWVAEQIHQRLMELPQVQSILEGIEVSRRPQ